MKSILCIPLFTISLLLFLNDDSCSQSMNDSTYRAVNSKDVRVELIRFFDATRNNRLIPVAIYTCDTTAFKQKLVLINHGYGENKGGSYLDYSYLAKFLAREGYFVASIQHELPTDDPLPMEGNLQEARMPNWLSGELNMLCVWKELKARTPNLDEKKVIVVGHSNGGDMAMLFASDFELKIMKAISLDNLRMPLPLYGPHKIYTLRSTDAPADSGVLPNAAQQEKFGITVVQLATTKHLEMTDDTASDEQKKEINQYVLKFILEK